MEDKESYKNKCGPGYWDFLHRVAMETKTSEDWNFLFLLMEKYSSYFGCPKCRDHFKSLIKKYKKMVNNRFRKMKRVDTNEKIGAYVMTIRMHNEVNERLNKPQIENSQSLFDYYKTKELSEEDCHEFCT